MKDLLALKWLGPRGRAGLLVCASISAWQSGGGWWLAVVGGLAIWVLLDLIVWTGWEGAIRRWLGGRAGGSGGTEGTPRGGMDTDGSHIRVTETEDDLAEVDIAVQAQAVEFRVEVRVTSDPSKVKAIQGTDRSVDNGQAGG